MTCAVEAVDYNWEGSPALLRARRQAAARERSAAESRPGGAHPPGESSVSPTVLPAQPRLTQQRRTRAAAERNNAAFEQRGTGQRLYDRVRKRAPRLPHGGTVAALPAHEERFWARMARPARAEQKAVAAEARGLESSSLRPASAGNAMEFDPGSAEVTVQPRLRPLPGGNPHVPKKTGRRRQAGVGDLSQIQLARHASTLAYHEADLCSDEPNDATCWSPDPPPYDPLSNFAPRPLSTKGGYRYRRDKHGFMAPCARGAYYVVSSNPDPVRRSAQSASVVEFVLVKQRDGQARLSHLARHPCTFPPGMPGNFERWQWRCAIYIQKIARGYIWRTRLSRTRNTPSSMSQCID
jgi:hypothetical protein